MTKELNQILKRLNRNRNELLKTFKHENNQINNLFNSLESMFEFLIYDGYREKKNYPTNQKTDRNTSILEINKMLWKYLKESNKKNISNELTKMEVILQHISWDISSCRKSINSILKKIVA